MITIPNKNHDPALNLAMEEYILTGMGLREPVLFFYVNSPSIIIGRHQNTIDEINLDFVREHEIQIVRRCSGGGAVYHDLGNLNYSLIRPGDTKASCDFSDLLDPILGALHALGLPAERSGRNDLTIDGMKFSGNAYYHNRHGSVIHGTLLFDSDLSMLSKSLRPQPEKLSTKGIASVRSRVTCLKAYLPHINDTGELESAILSYFAKAEEISTRSFSGSDEKEIQKLAAERYRNDTWTFGESPAYNVRRLINQPGGWIDFRADVRNGTITEARFFGDYFTSGEIQELEDALSGTSWKEEELSAALKKGGWEQFFPGLQLEEFINLVINSGKH